MMQPLRLDSWLVDRAMGMTAEGLVEVVVLVLRAEGKEFSVCVSKEDAMLMQQQLQQGALHARATHNDKRGYRSE